MLSRDKDKPMFAGICRALESGKDILPHEDKIERDDPSRCGKSFWGQIAINLYLQPCEEGGKLQMWNISLADEKYKSLCGDSYGISRDKLAPPDLEIKPDTGDLVLFNPTNLHAVEKVAKTRLSISCFMGCESSEDALKFWS
jgi:2OG-Fe(II) oxygenase superfamily